MAPIAACGYSSDLVAVEENSHETRMSLPSPPSPRSEALRPVLWLIGTALAALAVGSFSNSMMVQVFLMTIIGLGVTLFFCAYVYLLLRDPDRLQSEIYLMKTLGDNASPPVTNAQAPPVANTAVLEYRNPPTGEGGFNLQHPAGAAPNEWGQQ